MSHVKKFITKDQHGFVKSKNCTTNLLETIDLITENLANQYSVDVTYVAY